MFSYYGSKSKIVSKYPKPRYQTIIEPFAGSARYSLEYWENTVILNDLSPYVYEVWKYLQAASEKDVLGLPDVPSYVNIDEYGPTKNLTDAEKWLIGFELCRGKSKPRKVGHAQNSWNAKKIEIAKQLFKIRHWKIYNLSYCLLSRPRYDNVTYFIDPPYQDFNRSGKAERYPVGHGLNYDRLADWVKSLTGQVVFCEGSEVDYLPVQYLTLASGTARMNAEYIYTQSC